MDQNRGPQRSAKLRLLAVGAVAVLVLVGAVLLAESFRYPRIARSGFWWHPALLLRATVLRLIPGDGVSRDQILEQARRLGPFGELDARLLVLPDDPVGEQYGVKSIQDRVFGMVEKGSTPTEQEIFWAVAPKGRIKILDDNWLAFEYKTGRLVCGREAQR